MEVSYQRDLDHNYMILENEAVTGEEYTVRMIEHNVIPELLRCQLRRMNGKTYLYYEITSRQPMSQIYESNTMKSRDIEMLLTGIQNGLIKARQYLLTFENFLLDPEYIYMDPESGKVQLCYCPGLVFEASRNIFSLSEYILKRLDHSDRRAVELGYQFYGRVSQENFSLWETLDQLLKEEIRAEDWVRRNVPKAWEYGPLEERSQIGKTEEEKGRERGFRQGQWEKENTKEKQPGKKDFDRKENRKMEKGFWLEEEEWKGAETSKKRKDQKERKNSKSSRDVKSGKAMKNTCEDSREIAGGKQAGMSWIKNAFLCGLVIAFLLLIFAGIVYFAGLDLAQTGGLAFFILAVSWIIYGTVTGKKKKEEGYWLEEEEDDEEFLEQLLEDLYDKPKEETEDGETRCLTEEEFEDPLYLVSLEPGQYPDLVLSQFPAVLGKKRDQVDIWLASESVSRIHAKLEKKEGNFYITDLNSMNGTFVNGQRLMPREQRMICQGDGVSLATLRYICKSNSSVDFSRKMRYDLHKSTAP